MIHNYFFYSIGYTFIYKMLLIFPVMMCICSQLVARIIGMQNFYLINVTLYYCKYVHTKHYFVSSDEPDCYTYVLLISIIFSSLHFLLFNKTIRRFPFLHILSLLYVFTVSSFLSPSKPVTYYLSIELKLFELRHLCWLWKILCFPCHVTSGPLPHSLKTKLR